MTESTVSDCLKSAWAALLRGDTAERDRLCERAKVLQPIEHYANAVQKVMAVDFYVTRRGTAIPTPLMAQRAGVLQ